MNRYFMTLVIVGSVAALATPSFAASSPSDNGFQLAQAADDDAPGEPPAPPPGAPPGPPPGHAMMEHHQGMMGHGEHNPEHMFRAMCHTGPAHEAAALAYAEVELKITDAQKPAWTKFATAVKAAHEPLNKVCTELLNQPELKTLPERLARMEAISSAHAAHLSLLRPAVTEMYNQLTPEQKKQADSFHPGHHGPGEDF